MCSYLTTFQTTDRFFFKFSNALKVVYKSLDLKMEFELKDAV
jgi:hypothetical protein